MDFRPAAGATIFPDAVGCPHQHPPDRMALGQGSPWNGTTRRLHTRLPDRMTPRQDCNDLLHRVPEDLLGHQYAINADTRKYALRSSATKGDTDEEAIAPHCTYPRTRANG